MSPPASPTGCEAGPGRSVDPGRDRPASLPLLEARGLSKRYGDLLALDSLDLVVGAAEILCLLGANGAGKTTTLNLFLGFSRPTAGAACVESVEVATDPAAARAKLGYLAEVVSLYPLLTGAENLDFFLALAGVDPLPARRMEILERLRFPADALDRPAGGYSKGMRQKLGLAIAILKNARAILLDEPLSGLDPAAANELVGLLRETAAAGVGLLIATHDIFRARDLGGRIGIMRRGRLVRELAAAAMTAAELERTYLADMAA